MVPTHCTARLSDTTTQTVLRSILYDMWLLSTYNTTLYWSMLLEAQCIWLTFTNSYPRHQHRFVRMAAFDASPWGPGNNPNNPIATSIRTCQKGRTNSQSAWAAERKTTEGLTLNPYPQPISIQSTEPVHLDLCILHLKLRRWSIESRPEDYKRFGGAVEVGGDRRLDAL